jgi:hypothetical protein
MGRFDRSRPQDQRVRQTASPPAAGRDNDTDDLDGPDHAAIARPVQLLLAIGIDGQWPLASAVELADAARTTSLTTEEAVARVGRTTTIRGAAGGLITGVGGFWAMPVALPVNVVEFYVQAARMVGAIATLSGHDVGDFQVRRAVLQTLIRTQTESELVKAVSAKRGSALTRPLMRLRHQVPGWWSTRGSALACCAPWLNDFSGGSAAASRSSAALSLRPGMAG